ncbi:MAG: phenylalanyl-tRNA synthetase alpha chain [Candidatus Berkelbacteria bacterium Gr01-1014_85]|uniref:phenylalanine--tRNA ligase n=1 Tax=Candidatus Berkelbacteria bacterium Gr01-1014_85 TaxID=2017150 RepID=A0A554JAU1_9BACT|nr:MAG: phenylalanyl-tRNA synthetase alpha chain [Candidatus Berkelbacteria bacterium Gr01-1014_85]
MIGHYHPMTVLVRQIVSALSEQGFQVYNSPELETEANNFDFLRVPADHPARDSQDTFWTVDGRVLRTHTTSSQANIRATESDSQDGSRPNPPFRVLVPGRVFRNEATDATHLATLNQIDGIVVDEQVNLGQLLATVKLILEIAFGQQLKIRQRPHHYPFVEPGLDIDVYFQGRWIEALGCGLIHPEILAKMDLDPDRYQGFAFGIGLDRLCMMRHGLTDIRHLTKGDLRFNQQLMVGT